MVQFPSKQLNGFLNVCQEKANVEHCGLLCSYQNTPNTIEQINYITNVSANPENEFKMDLQQVRGLRQSSTLRITGMIHNHPSNVLRPSNQDIINLQIHKFTGIYIICGSQHNFKCWYYLYDKNKFELIENIKLYE